MRVKNPNNSTTLSSHFWSEKEEGRGPSVKWKIWKQLYQPFIQCKKHADCAYKKNLIFYSTHFGLALIQEMKFLLIVLISQQD